MSGASTATFPSVFLKQFWNAAHNFPGAAKQILFSIRFQIFLAYPNIFQPKDFSKTLNPKPFQKKKKKTFHPLHRCCNTSVANIRICSSDASPRPLLEVACQRNGCVRKNGLFWGRHRSLYFFVFLINPKTYSKQKKNHLKKFCCQKITWTYWIICPPVASTRCRAHHRLDAFPLLPGGCREALAGKKRKTYCTCPFILQFCYISVSVFPKETPDISALYTPTSTPGVLQLWNFLICFQYLFACKRYHQQQRHSFMMVSACCRKQTLCFSKTFCVEFWWQLMGCNRVFCLGF